MFLDSFDFKFYLIFSFCEVVEKKRLMPTLVLNLNFCIDKICCEVFEKIYIRVIVYDVREDKFTLNTLF